MKQLEVVLVGGVKLVSPILLTKKQKIYKQYHVANKTYRQNITDYSFQTHHS
jgi:hypothetical protein